MGLLKRRKSDAQGFWATGIAPAEVAENSTYLVKIGREEVILTRIDDAIFAFESSCPHAAADLSNGTLHGGRITCPLHGWKFDVKSGRTLWPEDESCRLTRYEVRVDSAEVRVRLT